MNNSLSTDFTAFVDNRLNYVDKRLKDNPDYKRQTDNIDKLTQDLLAAMPTALTCTLGDIDDSHMELITLSERFSYRQGFRDAITFLAEL